MLRYYKRSLINLLGQVRELRDKPWGKRELCLEIQESLIKKVFYVEKRIREFNKLIKQNKNRIGTKQTPLLTKEEAARLKDDITKYRKAKEDCEFVLNFLRSIGDALAFIYLSRWDIKQMTFDIEEPTIKETAGFMSGKDGFSIELQTLRHMYQGGVVAILCDLTRCLRYGDIVVIQEDKPFQIIEMKSSHYQSKRIEKQQSKGTQLSEYFRTDKATIGGYKVTRKESTIEYIDHCSELNKLLQEANTQGFGFSEVEQGLYYYVEMQEDKARNQSIARSFSHPPMFFFLNMSQDTNFGYYPFTLSIEDPETIFKFYTDQIRILVFIDPDVIKSKFQAHGFMTEFDDDEKWFLTITAESNNNSSCNQYGPMAVGRFYFFRIPLEFISLDWLIGETIYTCKNPPIETLTEGSK
jgi:uncharacterized protein YcgL (UPF0745 family)